MLFNFDIFQPKRDHKSVNWVFASGQLYYINLILIGTVLPTQQYKNYSKCIVFSRQ